MVDKLLTKLRGKDYRAAYRVIPQLCRLNDGSLAAVVASYKPKDEQRRFQLELARIALAEGIEGLTKQWLRLGTEEQRRVLLQEIGGDWGDEWAVEIAIAALEEPDDKVRGYAVLLAKHAAQRGISADHGHASRRHSFGRWRATTTVLWSFSAWCGTSSCSA